MKPFNEWYKRFTWKYIIYTQQSLFQNTPYIHLFHVWLWLYFGLSVGKRLQRWKIETKIEVFINESKPCYKKENRGILYSPSVKRSPYPAHPTESSCIVDIISITIIQVVSASHVCKYSNIGKVWSQDFLYSLLKLKISNLKKVFVISINCKG